jgi:hypothetical protein
MMDDVDVPDEVSQIVEKKTVNMQAHPTPGNRMPAQGSSNKSKFLSVKPDPIQSPPKKPQPVSEEH